MRMFRCALLVAVCAIQLAAEDAKVGYVDCSSGDKHPPTAVFSNPCTSQPVGALSCGEEVKVLGREGPWLRIASADGGERYISALPGRDALQSRVCNPEDAGKSSARNRSFFCDTEVRH